MGRTRDTRKVISRSSCRSGWPAARTYEGECGSTGYFEQEACWAYISMVWAYIDGPNETSTRLRDPLENKGVHSNYEVRFISWEPFF